jgi:CRP/FNR family transcriptional regulator
LKNAVDSFLNSFELLCPEVTKIELDFIKSGLSITTLKPKDFFLSTNSIHNEIGFVFSGLIRGYFLDDNGHDITVKFIDAHQFATDYAAFISQNRSNYSFQCLEPTVIVSLSNSHIQEGYERFPKLERYGRLVAEEVLCIQQKRIEGFLFKSPEERYLDFINEYPDLFNRVTLTHLSSYLGIERQTLTRIRQRLSSF